MRIVHLSTAHPLYDVRIYAKEAVSAASHDCKVHVIAVDAAKAPDNLVDEIETVSLKPIKNRFARMAVMPIVAWCKALSIKADIYQFHDPELLPLGVVLSLCGYRIIYDVHENVPEDILTKNYLPWWIRRWASVLFDYFEKWSAKKLSGVVVATEDISARFSGCELVATVFNYPRIEEERGGGSQLGRKNVVYGGVISEQRGIYSMLEATLSKKWPEGQYLELAGSVSDVLLSQLRKHRGWCNVKYHGALSQKEYFSLLASSRVGLCVFLPGPNHDESRPNKIFEYMAFGLPVVVSDFPLWKTIIRDSKAGICIAPTDPTSIASAVSQLIDDPYLCENMGNAGRAMVQRNYDWRSQEAKLLELYEKIVA
ncbi:glycosyltransferase [Tepidicaulis sp. LMO-SS28]|uniref:glycosyltransferase n=1 Tax=Tepidicaulis sp. LMO-SS28 TaxID=3447455 RepID=UPI003EE32207